MGRGNIVVGCKLIRNGDNVPAESARCAMACAEALGAVAIALSPNAIAFAWDVEFVEDAVAFACGAVSEAACAEACAIAQGDVESLRPENPYAVRLSLGTPVTRAFALLTNARIGDVLVDSHVDAVSAGTLSCERIVTSTSDALRLNVRAPWVRPKLANSETRPTSSPVFPLEGTDPQFVACIREEEITTEEPKTAPMQSPPVIAQPNAQPQAGADMRCRDLLRSGWEHATAAAYDAALVDAMDALAVAMMARDARGCDAARALVAKLCVRTGRGEGAQCLATPGA